MALRVAYTVGRGTGAELAQVFERVIRKLSTLYAVPVELHRSPRIYHSYFSLIAEHGSPKDAEQETLQDVLHYERFCEEQVAQGTRVTFKTAINAQSLYLVRQHLQAVKVECFNQGSNALLLVRDQSQGFYTGSNQHHTNGESVSRTCEFSKELTGRMIAFSLQRARQLWGPHAIDSVSMVYKFHLFDGIFSIWAKEWSKEHGVRVEFVQPDTANRNLLAFGVRGRQLMIAGNEWADIMHVIILDMLGQGAQEARCTENVYLRPDVQGLSEYQTVHGSADDIAGQGLVNPSATVRAAAAILERHGACHGVEALIDRTLLTLRRMNVVTRDQAGDKSTTECVDAILQNVESALTIPPPSDITQSSINGNVPIEGRVTLGKKTAILVLDFQNDFVTHEGIGAEYRGNMDRMLAPKTNIPKILSFARLNDLEVIFVRFLGDAHYQRPNMQYRDAVLRKRPKCLEGTWGAEIHASVRPARHERVFDKQAHFDAFLCQGFESYLADNGYEHLILLGVYCDVCVDSTARTGFQKGYFVTVVPDCTTTLHLPVEECLAYMKRVYGARIVDCDELLARTP